MPGKRWYIKRGIPIAAVIVLCAVAVACAIMSLSLRRVEEPEIISQPPQEHTPTLRYRADIRSMLVASVDNGGLRMVSLMTVNNRGDVTYLAIPKDTRVKRPEPLEGGYISLSDLYNMENGGIAGLDAMRAAVSTLLGGVPVDNGAVFGEGAVASLIRTLDGVTVDRRRYSAYVSKTGGKWLAEATNDPEYVLLDADEAAAFVRGGTPDALESVPGTDIEYISTAQHLTDRVVERARQAGIDAIAAMLDSADEIAVSTDAREEFISFLSIPITSSAALALLNGEDRAYETRYWLPDEIAVKRWVIEQFYEMR